MVGLGVKKSRAPLVHVFVLVLAFSGTTVVPCHGIFTNNLYETSDLAALQALWGAWNVSTPQPESNLAGWNSSQEYPCSQEINVNRYSNWRGVQCLTKVACEITNSSTGDRECNSLIVGLSLENASIAGTLPPDIGNISTLTTLELIGNPKLDGLLPDTLNHTNLYILDLHDNGFHGEIPDFGDFEWPLTLDLSGNRFSGSFPYRQIQSMVFLRTLKLGRNDFEGEIPENAFEKMKPLEELDLSRNRFNGTLPTLNTTKNLRTLDLSSNQFTESALEFWSPAVHGPYLQELYLDNNLIKGTLNLDTFLALGVTRYPNSSSALRVLSLMNNSIENVTYNKSSIELYVSTVIRLQGNPYCDSPEMDDERRCFCKQLCIHTEKNGNQSKAVMISVVTSVSVSMVLLVAVIAAFFYRGRRYERFLQLQVQQKFEEFEVKPTIFPYNQLRTATQDFHSDMKLGQGAFGAVYKGVLPKGNVVAVKKLFAKTAQGVDEFLNEVVLLTGMKHRNLVNLKGCCIREQQRLLVYEYVDNYDVDKLLLQNPTKVLLSWPLRLKICLGVARGLHYLHALAHPRIIHRDIKSSNVLLTNEYEAKIADFGLAALFPDEESYIMTKHVAGTKGYLAPEYASYGQLSDKVDVFSFGVLCLEIVGGRRNLNEKLPPDEIYLPNLAWDLHRQGNLMSLVDPTLSLQDEEKLEAQRLITISLLCIQMVAVKRPSMEQVVAMLQGQHDLETKMINLGEEEHGLKNMRLFAFAESDLGTMWEEGESSDMESSMQATELLRSKKSPRFNFYLHVLYPF